MSRRNKPCQDPASQLDLFNARNKEAQKQGPQLIVQSWDGLDAAERLVVSVMHSLARNGRVEASLSVLAREVSRKRLQQSEQKCTQRQLDGLTTRTTIRNVRDRLKLKGVIAREYAPTYFHDAEVFRIRSAEEILEYYHAAGITHWKQQGRGRKLLTATEAAKEKRRLGID